MAPSLIELRKLLPERSIDLEASAPDRTEAIRMAGTLLIAAGSVEPEYVDEMLDREQAVSTFVGDGIAMPHGTLTAKSDVLVEGLSLLRFAEPVDWNGEQVTIVIGIAAHGRRYIALLSQLATALLDGDTAARLRETRSVDEVYELLSS
jgi:PTS system mannitol-specific IIA component